MFEMSGSSSDNAHESLFTSPSLPKGGGTVSAGGGMLSTGSADGGASLSLQLPLPAGRALSPEINLSYSSGGGNGCFGAGWDLGVPAIFRMNRFGVPRYDNSDRLVGPDGSEILPENNAVREASGLPFSTRQSSHYTVTSWVSRSGGRADALEHWVKSDARSTSPEAADFWLQWHPDGSISLFGWSDDARLCDPENPAHVAGWFIEETVSSTGEHIVFKWRSEDEKGCDSDEKRLHPQCTNVYLDAVYALNVTPSEALLIPENEFDSEDFLSFLCLDYGESDTPPDIAPAPASSPSAGVWPVREDVFSFWRYGFEVRTRRLCHNMMLWNRTGLMRGESDITPVLISRLHLTYASSPVTSELLAAQTIAYEPGGSVLSLPPEEFSLTQPGGNAIGWTAMSPLDGFCPPRWQLADLFGEGLSGLLYLDDGAWWYRAPERAKEGGDVVTWGAPVKLPMAPHARGGSLTDLDGDGRPEWLVTMPGLNGSFTLNPDGTWSGFVPLEAMPSELTLASAQLADLTGGGLQDVVMIGPRSVRLWPSAGSSGWRAAETTHHDRKQPLPPQGDEASLVAFADIAGGGLPQLAEITGSGVTIWPSLGHGRFGEAISIPGFMVDNFAANRIFLGDTDGSGTTDILYVESDCIRVFVSESGNRFTEARSIPAPEGVHFDETSIFQVADVTGSGTGELMLTVPHMSPRSWLYRFNASRPWLLSETCNNMGSRTRFFWRSSAQGWLDEKAELQAAGRPAVSYLPFAVHTLRQLTRFDDISGLIIGTEMHYQGGVWDGREREFCGFSRLVQRDTTDEARNVTSDLSSPVETRTWFLTGIPERDAELLQVDRQEKGGKFDFPLRSHRLTSLKLSKPDEYIDTDYSPPDDDVFRWLMRALRGLPVRNEIFGLDESDKENIPYTIVRQRWQVRVYDTLYKDRPSALVIPSETLTLTTERIIEDPVVTQSLVLETDTFGNPVRTAEIRYPRRMGDRSDKSAFYPRSLPTGMVGKEGREEEVGLVTAAEDDQQYNAWVTLVRTSYHNLHRRAEGIHLTGLPDASRTDILQLTLSDVPEEGFSTESFIEGAGPLAGLYDATLGGYVKTHWATTTGERIDVPGRPALTLYTETALMDEASLSAYDDVMDKQTLAALLEKGGYHETLLPAQDGFQAMTVWSGYHNLPEYMGPQSFYSLSAVRDSELTGKTVLKWDKNYLAVTAFTDAAGLCTSFEYDWRFRKPSVMFDPNDNVHETRLDALGRMEYMRFRGTELDNATGKVINTGYSDAPFSAPHTVPDALALSDIPVHTAQRVVTDCWMPVRPEDMPGVFSRAGELALRRWYLAQGLSEPEYPRESREPPHLINLLSDRYDGDPAQQVRINVTYTDGEGRSLQNAALNPPGEALVRTHDGALQAGQSGTAITVNASVRWAVTGKTEYDDKGQPVRTWLPYYLNDWRPVYDDTARDGIFADTYIYDAPGRVIKVITAAGWERRTQYFPWFTVDEDENDTAEDVLAQRNKATRLQ